MKFLASQASLDLTYSAVGATAATPPARFVVDHTRAKIGEGQAAFDQAKAALCRWDQFRLGWLEAYSPRDVIQPGNPVALFARRAGLWWLNVCRVIYVIDEPGPIHRYGYAYGTLPDHAASGEERFLVEWNPADNVVWYDILAFSRPRNLLSRLGVPLHASNSEAIWEGFGGGDDAECLGHGQRGSRGVIRLSSLRKRWGPAVAGSRVMIASERTVAEPAIQMLRLLSSGCRIQREAFPGCRNRSVPHSHPGRFEASMTFAHRFESRSSGFGWACLSFSRWQSIQLVAYGSASRRVAEILPPQNSHRPKTPAAIR